MNRVFSGFFVFFFTSFIFSCQTDLGSKKADQLPLLQNIDPHSFGDDSPARVKHFDLQLKVDFNKHILSGFVTLFFEKNGADTLFLDTKNLSIDSLKYAGKIVNNYSLGESDPVLGSKMTIDISNITDSLTIYYKTSPQAAAIQWLEKNQTLDKKAPFLYTQGQAILTRSWIPIQDSPGIRATYNATITVPKGMLALMSAENPQVTNDSGVYNFSMNEPIPAYLVALAVGVLKFSAYDERSGVYAEPGLIEKAAYEFAETPEMMKVSERLYGPYIWGRFDILVLPPAFPFGGMENPRLTFATPTVIAGDRSLANLIAHELAHSWSGNLVTNATWDDFWLNEGFTVYFERRIMEEVKNKDYAQMNAILGRNDLEIDLEALGQGTMGTQLKLNLAGKDPDEGMTDVAYEKGYLFVALLEETFGREKVDQFLKEYFEAFKFETITTEKFEDYLFSKFDKAKLAEIKVNEWLYRPDLPDNAPIFKTNMFKEVTQTADSIIIGQKVIPNEAWDFNQWMFFLRGLENKVNADQLEALDAIYEFSNSGNTEIRAIWYELNIKLKNDKVNKDLAKFLNEVGRRKFLMPLYEALVASGQKDVAVDIYKKARPSYHYVAQNSLDALLL